MTRSSTARILLTCGGIAALAVASPSWAQHGGGGAGAGPGGGGQTAMPGMTGAGDMDRMQDRDRLRDPDQDRDRDQDRDKDQDRLHDRDRLRIDQTVSGQLSTWSLLSEGERRQFHEQMRAAKTEEERNRIRSQHRATVQQRARDLGIDQPGASGWHGGYYLAQMLTERERLQFHERMRVAANEQERARIRAEMHATARERAREMGIDVPAWFGQRRTAR
ncbi:hypothetical protein EKN06_00950 [Croceicoccus ponticola]|uniref:DUF3106 domain-containing protein n=1 Tax=Croceicoccus ponticola TaxID=2217664 RepID=A0A437GZR1_9SPHN|nr:hypothetical protein [Croceicoccus ponticola]RVQ68829.1 hypothetical protein EKN06_00950 [Croceicoccus ponticola]